MDSDVNEDEEKMDGAVQKRLARRYLICLSKYSTVVPITGFVTRKPWTSGEWIAAMLLLTYVRGGHH